MTMAVPPWGILLDQPNALLHSQKRNNPSQNPQSNAHIVAVTFLTVRVPMGMTVIVTLATMMVMRLDGMRNQV